MDYGILFDALHATDRTGYSCTIFLTNFFLMPSDEAVFLAPPEVVFDTPDEMAEAGWCVD
jgi:hypothetical protein